MDNPLLSSDRLPRFSLIRPEHIEPAVDQRIVENREYIERLLGEGTEPSWSSLVEPLEELEERLHRVWAPVAHLSSVADTEALRAAYNRCRPKISEYETDIGQREDLFRAYRAVSRDAEALALEPAQRKLLNDVLRDFRLAGVELSGAHKARFKDIQSELTRLTNRFDDNVLDATHGWTLRIAQESELAGLPPSAVALARQYAERQGVEGYLLTLELPCYVPVVTYAEDRDLRREIYEAFATRGSDRGPHAGRWDNGEVMEQILRLRHEMAQLLGFSDYAEYSLATKMAPSCDAVVGFLEDLAARSRPIAERELEEVGGFAREHHGVSGLEVWDLTFYSEKLRQHRYAITQEDLRPYFPHDRVLRGLFAVAERLFGVHVHERSGVDAWHPDVRFFEVRDPSGELRGEFYLDLFARPGKRAGAWMGECAMRHRRAEHLQTPVAFLCCNFTPPLGDAPSLLTHPELTTLFHEFGHTLHHLLTRVDYRRIAGINGVAWDAVELPSQLLENWCWEREALRLIGAHHESGEALPEELFERMLLAKHFQAGMQMVRQIEFALFDFRLHHEYDPVRGGRIYEILEEVRERVAVVRPPSFNRFAHAFSHIFSGGYAAGYYSYKWAEVLSADAFARFEETGIFNAVTGREFLRSVLEQGGSRAAMELFREFRGRDPDIGALLRHSGMAP